MLTPFVNNIKSLNLRLLLNVRSWQCGPPSARCDQPYPSSLRKWEECPPQYIFLDINMLFCSRQTQQTLLTSLGRKRCLCGARGVCTCPFLQLTILLLPFSFPSQPCSQVFIKPFGPISALLQESQERCGTCFGQGDPTGDRSNNS